MPKPRKRRSAAIERMDGHAISIRGIPAQRALFGDDDESGSAA